MQRQGGKRRNANEHGIPVEDAGLSVGLQIGPQWSEEAAACIERNTANNISKRGPVKDGQQDAAKENPTSQNGGHTPDET